MTRRRANHGQAARPGQALVEFALVLPMFLVLLLLIADVGRAFSAYIELGNVAREGAHFGSLNADNAVNATGIAAAGIGEVGTIFGTAPAVQSRTGTDAYGYQFVTVTATYTFRPLVTFPPIPESLALRRDVRMRVIGTGE